MTIGKTQGQSVPTPNPAQGGSGGGGIVKLGPAGKFDINSATIQGMVSTINDITKEANYGVVQEARKSAAREILPQLSAAQLIVDAALADAYALAEYPQSKGGAGYLDGTISRLETARTTLDKLADELKLMAHPDFVGGREMIINRRHI
jgi:hypothetical protein